MRQLLPLELDILGCLYFPEPLDKIVEETEARETHVRDSLRFLIDNKLVTVVEADEKGKEAKTFIYDTDNMANYRYLATRKGLLAHNSKQG